MGRVHLTIKLRDRDGVLTVDRDIASSPLRRAYVQHIVGGIAVETYITDEEGRVRDKNGDLGINSFTNWCDIRICCQNSVVRVLNGEFSNIMVYQDRGVQDDDTVILDTAAEQVDHFRILNRCLRVYDVVHRQFEPFASSRTPDFPLGRKAKLGDTMEQPARIEVSYPDQLPQPLAFVEPASISTGYPLIHYKGKNFNPSGPRGRDGRLFGTDGERPILVAAEMAHGIHFSLLTQSQRNRAETDYAGFIMSELLAGRRGTHAFKQRTEPMVAFVEAFDHFTHRFFEFVRTGEVNGQPARNLQGPDLRQAFYRDELSGDSHFGNPAGTLVGGRIEPADDCTGNDVEGAVYGAIFLDLSRRLGMLTAVNNFLRSKALTFGEFHSWMRRNRPDHNAAMDAIKATWDL